MSNLRVWILIVLVGLNLIATIVIGVKIDGLKVDADMIFEVLQDMQKKMKRANKLHLNSMYGKMAYRDTDSIKSEE